MILSCIMYLYMYQHLLLSCLESATTVAKWLKCLFQVQEVMSLSPILVMSIKGSTV